jgi:hypothetical protein
MARSTEKPPASAGGSGPAPAPTSSPGDRCRAGDSGQLTLAASVWRGRLGVRSGREDSPGSRRKLRAQRSPDRATWQTEGVGTSETFGWRFRRRRETPPNAGAIDTAGSSARHKTRRTHSSNGGVRPASTPSARPPNSASPESPIKIGLWRHRRTRRPVSTYSDHHTSREERGI